MTLTYTLIGSVTQPNLLAGSSSAVAQAAFDDSGMWLYVSGQDAATFASVVNVFNVSDPTTPTLVGTVTLPSTSPNGFNGLKHGMDADGNYLYISGGSYSGSGGGWVKVFDISTRSAPTYVGDVPFVAGWSHEALCAPGDGYLYTSFRNDFAASGARLRIYTAGSSPTLVGEETGYGVNEFAATRGLQVAGGLAILRGQSTTFPTIRTVNVATRTAPVTIGTRSLVAGASSLEGAATDGATVVVVDSGGPANAKALDANTAGLTVLGTDGTASYVARAAFWDSGYAIYAGSGIYNVTVPAAITEECAATGLFNTDYAADYHAGRKITATSAPGSSCRLDIGLVAGLVVPGGWTIGVLGTG